MESDPQFTPPGHRHWLELGTSSQMKILNNVWCGECRKTVTIVNFSGCIERGDLVLEGQCMLCNAPVARLIEKT